MTHVGGAATKFSRQIVRVCREQCGSLAVSVVRCSAINIAAVECYHLIEPVIESDEELVLVESATGFILVNVPPGRIGSNALWRRRRHRTDSSGQWSVDVAGPNYVLNVN